MPSQREIDLTSLEEVIERGVERALRRVLQGQALVPVAAASSTTDTTDVTKLTPKQERLLLTVGEVAEVLNLGRTATYDLIRTKQLFSVKIGGSLRVPRQDIEEYVERLRNAGR